MWGGGLFLGQSRCHPKGAQSQRSPILGVPFYLCVHPLLQNYQTRRGITRGGGACTLGSATPPIPRERSSMTPHFWGVRLYLCLQPLTQNDQIRQGNTCRERCVFSRLATPLYLHKCVTKFVGESWISFLSNYWLLFKAVRKQTWCWWGKQTRLTNARIP